MRRWYHEKERVTYLWAGTIVGPKTKVKETEKAFQRFPDMTELLAAEFTGEEVWVLSVMDGKSEDYISVLEDMNIDEVDTVDDDDEWSIQAIGTVNKIWMMKVTQKWPGVKQVHTGGWNETRSDKDSDEDDYERSEFEATVEQETSDGNVMAEADEKKFWGFWKFHELEGY